MTMIENHSKRFGNMRAKLSLAVVVASLFLLLTGCLSTVRIKRDPLDPIAANNARQSRDTQGIPFYVKTALCKQQSVWLQPIYTLTLKRTITSKFQDDAVAKAAKAELPAPQVTSSSKVLALSGMDANVTSLRVLLGKPFSADETVPNQQAQVKQIEDLWAQISKKPDYDPLTVSEDTLTTSTDAFMASNASTVDTFVDYSRTYYYNSPRPWVGSSQVDAKLATDGTLTEGSAQNQTQTLSTFVSALPISSVLTKVAELGLGTAVTGAVPGAAPVNIVRTVTYELTVQQQTYKHTHSRDVGLANPCPIQAGGVTCPTPAGSCSYTLQIDTGDSSSPKDDSNSVKVNGTIQLPKANTGNK